MRIDGRVFIVTGASSGIGLATARALAARGGQVALLARSTQALRELALTLPGSLAVTADMTDFDGVRRAVADIHRHDGRIDGLINNAGRSYTASVEEIDSSGTAFMTVPQYAVYSSSKRALLGFSLTARAELAGDGIVVGEVYPSLRRPTSAGIGWAIRPVAARAPTTRTATRLSSSPRL